MLEVRTGCRLHFGLFELAQGEPMRYGGLGLMLAEPGWRLRFSKLSGSQPASTIVKQGDPKTSDDICKRIGDIRQRVLHSSPQDVPIQIEVLASLPLHSGLGAGTQLAAATAIGIKALSSLRNDSEIAKDLPDENCVCSYISTGELLKLSGRGKRSSIGLCGILNGGLILDHGLPAGYLDRSEVPRSIQVERISFDVDWQILLITPPNDTLVSGSLESELISIAAQHPNPNREEMVRLAGVAIRHATIDPNFESFTAAIDRFVDHAGALFEQSQGGRFNGEAVQSAVQLARKVGLRGVGQSSWGPTVFGFARDRNSAEVAIEQFNQLRPNDQWSIRMCHVSNSGARLEWYDR